MKNIIMSSFKYANIYLSMVLFALVLGLLNGLMGLNSEFLVLLAYLGVIAPIAPWAMLLYNQGLMIENGDLILPSDGAIILGHVIWYLLFYGVYFGYRTYRARQARSVAKS